MEYIFMQPPFEVKPFKEMTKKDAKKHFDWYVGNIPNRIEMLRNAYEVTDGGRKEDLDLSSESLVKVWNWYINKAEINEKSKEEIESVKNKVPEWIDRNIGSQKISLGWMSIAMDIAIYFSECFVREFATIKWGIVSKPNSLAYVNKPVLTGFKTGIELDATNIVKNLTLKVANGEKDSEALLKLYRVWIENV
jgi:hypothetical protein